MNQKNGGFSYLKIESVKSSSLFFADPAMQRVRPSSLSTAMHATPSHPTLLDVAIGAVVVDVVFLHLNYRRIVFVSDELTRWYTELGASAMAADILVITLATYAGVLWSVTADGRFRLLPAMARVVVGSSSTTRCSRTPSGRRRAATTSWTSSKPTPTRCTSTRCGATR